MESCTQSVSESPSLWNKNGAVQNLTSQLTTANLLSWKTLWYETIWFERWEVQAIQANQANPA